MTIQQAFDLALRHHQSGRLVDAETLYRQILAVQPNHAEALHHLGIVAQQIGRNDLAVEWILRAIALNPNTPAAHSNLGEAYRSMGRLDEAMASFRRALELKSDSAAAHYNRANVFREQGRLDEAVAGYRRALRLQPNYPEAHLNLGGALAAQGVFDEAIANYRRALELRPAYPEAANNLGLALAEQRQFGEAVAAYRHALEINPNDPDAHYNLGNAFRELGQLDEAEASFRQALQLHPKHLEAHLNLGRVLQSRGDFDHAISSFRRALELRADWPEASINLGVALAGRGQLDDAISAYRLALELKPDSPEAYSNLGFALKERGQLDEALAEYRRALELKPDSPELHLNLGAALKDQGQLDEAIAAYRHALQLDPAYKEARSSLIYTLHLHPAENHTAIAEEHRRWIEQVSVPLRRSMKPHANDRDPERRLRVGYVSPDFRFHPISFFVAPLLKAHDRERFEIYCYASAQRPDAMTTLLRKSADVWRDVRALSDAQLAECVREDGIDILVDLALHTAHNRLETFARKPAPLQISWLGYPASSGLPTMDYRITDDLLEPEGSPWSASVETPIRLPDTWCCFEALVEYPEPGALPALRAGHVTFGSLNNFSKLNDAVLRLWVEVLRTVEGSRLLMQCPAGATQTRVRHWFESQGIAAHRLALVSRTACRAEFLQLFDRIDIALDPFPYNGGTTTFEALWMGIPVVSLAGKTSVGRVGLSALTNLGLLELVAFSEDDYVQIAVRLAGNLPCLAEMRTTLRARMRTSALMDGSRFARNMEAAYREMWQHWCAEDLS